MGFRSLLLTFCLSASAILTPSNRLVTPRAKYTAHRKRPAVTESPPEPPAPSDYATPELPATATGQLARRRHHRAVITANRLKRQQQQLIFNQQQQEEVDLESLSSRFTRAVSALPETPAGEIELFRHRFLVSSDLCIRLPIEAATLLRAFVVHSHLSGVIHLQLEAFRPLSRMLWSPDAQRMLSLPNAGGSSLVSETLAFELLARAFGASLERTELELLYSRGSKMTDFAIHLFGGYPLGVSVTRAYKWRKGLLQERVPKELDVCEAKRLLVKKLEAINTSSRNVQNYRFRKQILLVWAFTHRDATLLEQIYTEVPASLRANTVLLITRCNGVDWINMPDRLLEFD